jgi:hypothetical protein
MKLWGQQQTALLARATHSLTGTERCAKPRSRDATWTRIAIAADADAQNVARAAAQAEGRMTAGRCKLLFA